MSGTKYDECGRAWAEAAREREALERHDQEHPGDPIDWWQECSICAERVEQNFEAQLDEVVDTNIRHSIETRKDEDGHGN